MAPIARRAPSSTPSVRTSVQLTLDQSSVVCRWCTRLRLVHHRATPSVRTRLAESLAGSTLRFRQNPKPWQNSRRDPTGWRAGTMSERIGPTPFAFVHHGEQRPELGLDREPARVPCLRLGDLFES